MHELGTLPAFISLGAGVQSTAMVLLAQHGELPLPEAAIFADTQWEPAAVYDHLVWLERKVDRFPIVRVTAGSLRENIMDAGLSRRADGGKGYATPPVHVQPGGISYRQCTNQYKLRPIADEIRRRGFGPKRPVEQWLGISTDEAERMKPSRTKWQQTAWPLIELGMSRVDCLAWMRDQGYPTPPKSACVGCPLLGNQAWRERRQDPEQWADAVEVDERIRGMLSYGEAFLHWSKVPLSEVDLRTPEELGQLSLLGAAEGGELLAAQECGGSCFS